MFQDRIHAGNLLARKLSSRKESFDVVLAIPRGGVVIGDRISKVLNIPLRVLVVKKVSSLDQPELAVGAMGPGGVFVGQGSKETEELVNKNLKKFGKPGSSSCSARLS